MEWGSTPPQGLSLQTRLFCPSPSSLISPIRPTRGRIATSPTLRLIRDAFAVRERLGDPRVVPSFHCLFLPGMPPSMSPGRSESSFSRKLDSNMGLRQDLRRLGSFRLSRHPFQAGHVFRGLLVHHCYGLSGCSPPLTDLTGCYPSHEGFYIQAFSVSVSLPAAGYATTASGSSVGGTFTHWNSS